MFGLLGKKLGMTQIFDEKGEFVPVTVVQAGPCVVVEKKTKAKHGYEAVCIGFEEFKKEKLVGKPMAGHFKKAGTKAYKYLKEFKPAKADQYNVGTEVTVTLFKKGDIVDVSGVTKGKGFQGVIKRCGKKGGPMAHGSKFHRTTGSVGMRTWPGRVLPGTGMAGQMGNVTNTTKNLMVADVMPEKNLIFIRGSVSGSENGLVVVSNKGM